MKGNDGVLIFLAATVFCLAARTRATVVSTSFGRSVQVNVNSAGQNIPGDAANEPSMCMNPTNANIIAIGWRQFDTTNSSFRQSGVGYTTNGGLNWTFSGDLEPGTFRSDPVLASTADGVFYFLGISNDTTYACDLLVSSNGGAAWSRVGGALGGDKEWMAIDTTSGPGRGNLYEVWSPLYNVYSNNPQKVFTRSTTGGVTWMDAMDLPHEPYLGTVTVAPDGAVYFFGTAYDITPFVVDRSTNAQYAGVAPIIDLTTIVDLGGVPSFGFGNINPGGLLGQAWIAAAPSTGTNAGNLYVLCSIMNGPGNLCNVVFSRSEDRGQTWSAPLTINDDATNQNAAHWFGALSVAPNGRVDACWYDTRHSPDHSHSELYYSWSDDAGRTWAANRAISPPFDQSLGYPQQEKIGDYIQMISLDEGACIAYSATFNGEEDIYFGRAELPIQTTVTVSGGVVSISWNAAPGVNYCVQAKSDLNQPWSASQTVGCLTATNFNPVITDTLSSSNRFYRVIREP